MGWGSSGGFEQRNDMKCLSSLKRRQSSPVSVRARDGWNPGSNRKVEESGQGLDPCRQSQQGEQKNCMGVGG